MIEAPFGVLPGELPCKVARVDPLGKTKLFSGHEYEPQKLVMSLPSKTIVPTFTVGGMTGRNGFRGLRDPAGVAGITGVFPIELCKERVSAEIKEMTKVAATVA